MVENIKPADRLLAAALVTVFAVWLVAYIAVWANQGRRVDPEDAAPVIQTSVEPPD